MTPLCQLAIRYDTDKGPHGNYHAYTRRYHEILVGYQNDVRSVLEIGILGGSSLRMWRDYFPNAKITGVDVEERCVANMCGEDRIQALLGNEKDPLFLKKLNDLGPYDLVVDDASHNFDDYMTAFNALIGNTKLYYIIEDVQSSDWDAVTAAVKPKGNHVETLVSKTTAMSGAIILSL